jgi:hypothetical protein
VGAIALLVLDGAGWHSSPRVKVPANIVLLPLPPYAPALNPMENVWEFMRGNYLSRRVWDGYEAILDGMLRRLEQADANDRAHHFTYQTPVGPSGDWTGRLVLFIARKRKPALASSTIVPSAPGVSTTPETRWLLSSAHGVSAESLSGFVPDAMSRWPRSQIAIWQAR